MNLDPYGKLGTYSRINPDLETTLYCTTPTHYETDRILLTRYRTGSHSLRIESGRWTRIPRENRHCKCGPVVQSMDDVILESPIMQQHRVAGLRDIQSFFSHEGAADFCRHLYIVMDHWLSH